MTKKVLNIVLAIGCFGIIVFVGYMVVIFYAMGAFDSDYSVSELKENFNDKKSEIYELKKYFNTVVPAGMHVEIEFEDDDTLDRFEFSSLHSDPSGGFHRGFLEWNLETDAKRMDSIIEPLGWTQQTFHKLKLKLDAANCIGISSGEPAKIAFKRSGMGMYSFNVFDEPINDSLKETYNDGCTYILVNNRLALEYGGGAVGSQCFYNLK
jgi:hypothetical protein